MTKRRVSKRLLIAALVAVPLALGGCSEQERREMREHKERIAAEAARQMRLAQQYAAELAAETQRRADALAAETARRRNENISACAKVAAALAAIGGVIGWFIYSVRMLGERHLAERSRRHEQNLRAIEADPHLRPEDRRELLRLAIEANGRPSPLIGYTPGGAA